MVKERILWLDNLKLFAIYLVVLGHCLLAFDYPVYQNKYQNCLCEFIYSFHMPLFMLISGYFSNGLLLKRINIKKRFVQLILPCLSFTIICYSMGIYNQNFWYLKSLFLCYLIYSLMCFIPVNWLIRHMIVAIGLLIFSPLLPMIKNIDVCKVDFMLPFFSIGLLIAQYKLFVLSHLRFITIFTFICFVSLLQIWDWHHIWYFSRPAWIDYRQLIRNYALHCDSLTIYSYFLRLFVGLFGSIFLLSLFGWLESNWSLFKKICHTFGVYGAYSLHIYLLQSILFSLLEEYIHLKISHICLYTYLIAPLMAIIITAFCVVIAFCIKKNPLVDFILFGNYTYIQKK